MPKKELNGHKVGEAISDSTRAQILKRLIRAYPNSLTMSDIEKRLSKSVSPTTISFHLRKLREAGLVTSNGHKKGFRALSQAFNIVINNNGVRVEEVKK
jgi:DNA-binding transcriptional ArsR family regulator